MRARENLIFRTNGRDDITPPARRRRPGRKRKTVAATTGNKRLKGGSFPDGCFFLFLFPFRTVRVLVVCPSYKSRYYSTFTIVLFTFRETKIVFIGSPSRETVPTARSFSAKWIYCTHVVDILSIPGVDAPLIL